MKRSYQKNSEIFYIEMYTAGRICLFADPHYSGRIIDALKWICERKGVRLYNYVLMPDCLVMNCNTAWGVLQETLDGFQKFTSKAIVRILRHGSGALQKSWVIPVLNEASKMGNLDYLTIWEQSFEPVSMFRQEETDLKAGLIENLPVQKGIVCKPEHYRNSSANPDNPLSGWTVEPTDRGI